MKWFWLPGNESDDHADEENMETQEMTQEVKPNLSSEEDVKGQADSVEEVTGSQETSGAKDA